MLASWVWLIVGGVWGAATTLLLARTIFLSVKLATSTKLGTDALEAVKKAQTDLQEARDIFAANLKRPAVAYFNEEQVKEEL